MRLTIRTITIVGVTALAALTFTACGTAKPGVAVKASGSVSSQVAAAQASEKAQAASLAAQASAYADQLESLAASESASAAAASAASAAALVPQPIPSKIYITQDTVDAGSITVSNPRSGTGTLSEYGTPPTKGYYVAFTVRADSLINGLSISSNDFYVVEAGRHYEGSSAAYELDNYLSSVALNKGENAEGTIVFDVPSTHGVLQYSPNYDAAPIGGWKY